MGLRHGALACPSVLVALRRPLLPAGPFPSFQPLSLSLPITVLQRPKTEQEHREEGLQHVNNRRAGQVGGGCRYHWAVPGARVPAARPRPGGVALWRPPSSTPRHPFALLLNAAGGAAAARCGGSRGGQGGTQRAAGGEVEGLLAPKA